LVAVATLKKDAIFFLAGLSVGILTFGETIDRFLSDFWNSSNLGRFTLDEWLHLPKGVIVLGVVVMALFLFWLVEKIEAAMGGEKPNPAQRPYRLAGSAALIAVAVAVLVIGQPTPTHRWRMVASELAPELENRRVQIHPGELLAYIYNDHVNVIMLDVRDETDYNLFHILDARHASLEELPHLSPDLLQEPANTLFVVMSNDETQATAAWKILKGQSVSNVYILEGGINHWLDTFNGEAETNLVITARARPGDDTLRYSFPAALGAEYPSASPNPEEFEIEYTPKVELELPPVVGGG
jgi:rhodanese-related sulfurtransferase